jgi:hypothetical protein
MTFRRILDPPCHSAFNGGGGVRNSVACEVGPVSCHVTHRVMFPLSPPVLHSTARQGRSYWPSANPVGIRPYWPVANPAGVRRLQSRTIRHHCSAEV